MKNIKKIDVFLYLAYGFMVVMMGWVFKLYSINLSFFILIFIFLYYIKGLRRKKEPDYLAMSLLFGLSLSSLLLTKGVGESSSLGFYASCIIVLTILVNILYSDLEFSFIFLFLISILNGLIYGSNFEVFLIYFVAGSVAIFLSINVRKWFDIIKAGTLAGFMLFLMVVSLNVPDSPSEYILSFKLSIFNGILASVIVILIGILRIFEYLLGVVTNITLLELSDFNHPLLRRMILEAPGTYQHSLVVANLSEAAAETIGANSLLARVGAYYHDIGKISKSEYFSENQMLVGYKDKHKNLTPAMSKLIIMNHVKEGVELARKSRLNKKITEFVSQHHGTTLVYYFFRRAQEMKVKDPEAEDVYRYPGPKPQSKEVAIVHLADTIEARSRTVEEPTPARIKEMVREGILQKFLDGQLDETDLTLKDLEKIASVFVRMLNAMFHTRVEYPKPPDEHSDNRSSENSKNKNKKKPSS